EWIGYEHARVRIASWPRIIHLEPVVVDCPFLQSATGGCNFPEILCASDGVQRNLRLSNMRWRSAELECSNQQVGRCLLRSPQCEVGCPALEKIAIHESPQIRLVCQYT